MKKVLLILLSMALVFSMAGIVAGEETGRDQTIEGEDGNNDAGGEATADVIFRIHNGYVVELPSEFVFSETSTGSGRYTAGSSIKVDITTIGFGDYLNITMKSKNGGDSLNWYLKSDDSDDDYDYPYFVDVNTDTENHIDSAATESPIKNGEIVVSVPSDVTDPKTYLIHMLLKEIPTAAADYSDEITFTVTIGP